MPKLYKKRIFSFTLSLGATIIISFFILSIFVDFPGNITKQVLVQASKISSQFFSASISSPDYGNSVQEPDLQEDNSPLQDENPQVSLIVHEEESSQDLLDDIQEKLDVINQQVRALVAEQNQKDQPPEKVDENKLPDDKKEENLKEDNLTENNLTEDGKTEEKVACTGQININTASVEDLDKIIYVGPAMAPKIILARPFYSLNDLLRVSGIGETTLQKIIEQGCAYVESALVSGGGSGGSGGSGGGGALVIYPKILISEVKIAEKSGDKNVFVEIYNPNDTEVNLTQWYIFRNDSSFITKTMLEGKNIPANSYFLLTKEGSIWDNQSDLLFGETLNEDDKISLKNPDGDITDEINWSQIAENLSLGRKWDSVSSSYTDTDDSSTDLELDTPTPKAQNIKWIEPPAPTDTTPPEVVFGLPTAQNTLNFAVNFTITDLADVVSPSGVAIYVFRWQENGSDWQTEGPVIVEGNPISADFSRNFMGEDGKTYNFQVQATDVAGNVSDRLPATPATTAVAIPVIPKEILINEIQINPIEQRFVELYNPNNYEVDLTGWYIQRKTQNADSWSSSVSSGNFAGKIIPAGDYFLISRELTSSDILLNITLSDNNSLALKNPSRNIIDKVGWGQAADPESAPATNPSDGKSITRTSGIDTDNNSIDFIISDEPTPKTGP